MPQPLHTVHVRVNDAATGQPTPVRIQFTDENGTYHAPFGRFTEFSKAPGMDVGGNLLFNNQRYAYVDGTCEIQLPSGRTFIQAHKGPEYEPLFQELLLSPGQMAIRLEIKRWINLRDELWFSGDTNVALITPHAALLEAAAEDLAVVNLLIMQVEKKEKKWRSERIWSIPNLHSFSGQHPALERWGCMVVVNTHNYQEGGIGLTLLNCHRVVYPLYLEGPIGFDEWTFEDWCNQCHRKGGIVVCPPAEHLDIGTLLVQELPADFALGKIDALEFNFELEPEIIKEWYGFLNLGFSIPLVGGSGKMTNQQLLGGWRTYARLQPGEEFNYKNWIEAIRAGRTFATKGPLLMLTVNGQDPGGVINLESSDQTVHVQTGVRRAFPPDRLELIVNGKVVAESNSGVARPKPASGVSDDPGYRGVDAPRSPATPFEDSGRATQPTQLEMDVPMPDGGWIAAAYWGGEDSQAGFKLLAHTSPVYVQVPGRRPPPDLEAGQKLLQHFDEMLEWVRTQARVENEDQRARLARVFESAKEEVTKRIQP